MNATHRAAVLGQSLGGGAGFRRDQVADGLAGKARLAGNLGKVAVDARPCIAAADGDDRKQLVARPGDEQLHLAVLIDRSERGERRRPLAVLAEALGPELHIPMREAFEPVGIGHQHADAFAFAFGQ